MKLEFSDRFSKNTQNINFMKVHQVGAKLFHADRWTDMMNLLFANHSFVNACKKHIKSSYYHKEMQLQITYLLFTTTLS